MAKILIRIFSGIIIISALVVGSIILVNGIQGNGLDDPDLWVAIVILLAIAILFAFVLFNRYHKSFISLFSWLCVIALLGYAYDTYDRNIFQYGIEAYFILLILVVGFVLLGFLRSASWKKQLLIFICSVGCLFVYSIWFEQYKSAGKQIAKLENRTANFEEKLIGNKCFPPLKNITSSMLEPKIAELKSLDDQLGKHLPDSLMSTKILTEITDNAKHQGIEIIGFKAKKTRNMEFYSETKFSLLIRATQPNYARFVEKYFNGEQLIRWQDIADEEPNTMYITGTIYGYLDLANRKNNADKGFCNIKVKNIWLPPYTSRLDSAKAAFLQQCHQAEKYKSILYKRKEITELTGNILSRGEVIRALSGDARNEKLRKLKIDMPIPCL